MKDEKKILHLKEQSIKSAILIRGLKVVRKQSQQVTWHIGNHSFVVTPDVPDPL